MINLRIRRLPLNQHLLKKTLSRLSSTSVEPARKPTEEYYEKELKEFETLTNITKKVRQKNPQREPFVKNLLLANFDTDILAFPQLDIHEVKDTEVETNKLEKLLKQKHMVNVDTLSNKHFRQNLSDYRVIGLQAPQLLDGRESSPMQVMRYLETLSQHQLCENLVNHEMLSVQTLIRYADDKLKRKYLYPIIKGEKLAAFCLTEPKLIDMNSIQTKAELSADEKHWVLNGTKSFIVNGISADYLIVFAGTHFVKRDVDMEVSISALLVEKDTPGVSWKKLESADIELAEIVFDNVQVPAENIIGKVDEAEKILTSIVTDFRLGSGPPCITLTKNMLNKLHQEMVTLSTEEVELHATDAVRSRIGEIATNLYAVESVTYLTAGLQDMYENQDVSIESAIVKIFSSEVAYNTSTICLDMMGIPATLKDHWARRAHNDSLNYLTFHETNENLRMFTALTGLQYAGGKLHEKIKKLRNPAYNAMYMMSRIWIDRRNYEDDPKLDLLLNNYLHPSLLGPSKQLEYCVKRLEFATEKMLLNHGLECVNKHMELRTLADIMIDCYAMTAVLARASRSYCIGLQFSDYEMMLASTFCNLAKERVQRRVLGVYLSDHLLNGRNYVSFSKQFTKRKQYFIESPISRFF